MVPRCLSGDRLCVGVCAQSGGAAWHRGGVGGLLGESLRFDLHGGDGLAEDSRAATSRSGRMWRSLADMPGQIWATDLHEVVR